ncbi:unnamed protein product, partial [Symbiodinium sp. CCMP2456]
MAPMLKVKHTFISVDAHESDVKGITSTTKPCGMMTRSRSQECLGRKISESDQVMKLNRILLSDKEAVREARSPVATYAPPALNEAAARNAAIQLLEGPGWVEIGSFGAIPVHLPKSIWAPDPLLPGSSKLDQMIEELNEECSASSASQEQRLSRVSDSKKPGWSRSGSNTSLNTMISSCSPSSSTDADSTCSRLHMHCLQDDRVS